MASSVGWLEINMTAFQTASLEVTVWMNAAFIETNGVNLGWLMLSFSSQLV